MVLASMKANAGLINFPLSKKMMSRCRRGGDKAGINSKEEEEGWHDGSMARGRRANVAAGMWQQVALASSGGSRPQRPGDALTIQPGKFSKKTSHPSSLLPTHGIKNREFILQVY
jgi:hypothetical protein